MTTQGKRRFGKKRVLGCKCDYNFTCGECLRAVTDEDRLNWRVGHVNTTLINKMQETTPPTVCPTPPHSS